MKHPNFRCVGGDIRLHIDETADLQDAYVNVASGELYVGQHSFFGHEVMILTGRHEEMEGGGYHPHHKYEGHDIIIENNVWVASRAIIISARNGPRTIGHHSVICAGAVVTQDVPPYAMMVGNPAVIKKYLNE